MKNKVYQTNLISFKDKKGVKKLEGPKVGNKNNKGFGRQVVQGKVERNMHI